jgi:glycogen operon protein
MSHEDWASGFAKSVALYLDGEAISERDARGEPIVDDSFLLVFNAHHEPLEVRLPAVAERWIRVLDTGDSFNEGDTPAAGDAATVDARTIAVFRRTA